MAAQEEKESSIVVARMQVTLEHNARAMDGMAKQIGLLRETIAENHESYGSRITGLDKEQTRMETTLKVSRFWIGVCMTIFMGVATVLSWATAKFWDNLTDLNQWKVESRLKFSQLEGQINYGNEARRSLASSEHQQSFGDSR